MPEFLKGLGFMQLIDPGGSWGLISCRNDFFFSYYDTRVTFSNFLGTKNSIATWLIT